MMQAEEKAVKKICVSVHIGGRRKPIQKEALMSVKSGKIIRFVQKSHS
jgi:hypothetical protein